MKHLFFLLFASLWLVPTILHAKTDPAQEQMQPAAPTACQTAKADDDMDEKVVLANIANMLNSIGILSTDPYNPAVAGPSFAQIGLSFINIVTQMFKTQGIDEEITREHIFNWFIQLSDDEKIDLMTLAIQYADFLRTQQSYCPNCECECCAILSSEIAQDSR